MPKEECDYCGGHDYCWSWEEAFAKFGFNDGDGQIETLQVEAALSEAGYTVVVNGWGCHNTVIISIKRNGEELIPHDDPSVVFGYDDPRCYLPNEIVTPLDEKLPAEGAKFWF